MPQRSLPARALPRVRLLAPLLALALAAVPARGQCNSTTVFFEDFEGPLPGWSLTGDWVVSSQAGCIASCASGKRAGIVLNFGPNCLCDKDESNPAGVQCQRRLVSPWIPLPSLAPGESLELLFCADLYKNFNCFSVDPLDHCHRLDLRTSTGGGQQYLLLDGADPFGPSCPGPIVAPPFDLSAYAGESIQLTWEGGCVDSDGGRGIFNVDDVLIVHTQGGTSTYCTSLPNSSGAAAGIASAGTTSVAANDLVLQASGCPPGKLGLFFMGPNQSAGTPFGEGLLCVSGGIVRLVPAASVAPDGTVGVAVDNQAPPALGKLLPGSSWNFQFWFRDPAGGAAGFNLSDALAAIFCP